MPSSPISVSRKPPFVMYKAAIAQQPSDLEVRASNCVALCFSLKQGEFECIRRYQPAPQDRRVRSRKSCTRAKLPAKRSQAQQWRISPWTLLLAFNAVDEVTLSSADRSQVWS